MERDGVQVELWVPVQAEVDGQLEDEASYGQGRNSEAVEQDQLQPPDATPESGPLVDHHHGDVAENPEDLEQGCHLVTHYGGSISSS